MRPIQKRNEQILQLRKEGIRRVEVAQMFKLSPSRIRLIERRAAADEAMAERRSRLLEAIRAADDPQKTWPLDDLLDTIKLGTSTKNSLIKHFARKGMSQISLRELMNMCLGGPYLTTEEFAMPSLSWVCGIGPLGFWSVVNGLTGADFGGRCNMEWRERLAMVKWVWRRDPNRG